MNDNSDDESGFLKKILAARKDGENTEPAPGLSSGKKTSENADIDSLLKRIGLPDAGIVNSQGTGGISSAPPAGKSGEADAPPEPPAGEPAPELPQDGLPDLSDSEEFNNDIQDMGRPATAPFSFS